MFGNIFERKRAMIQNLEEVAHLLTINPSEDLENAQRDLWGKYEQILVQEEVLWFQKSRSKWIQFEDCNTKFFHGATAVRRRRNTYDILQDSNGNWIGDPNQLEAMVTNYFKTFFTDDGSHEPSCITGAFPSLTVEEKECLGKEVSRSEIFNVVNHMGSFKAPGPDGF